MDLQAEGLTAAADCVTAPHDHSMIDEQPASAHTWYTAFVFPQAPQPLYRATQEYAGFADNCPNTNFLKGVKWSPDGACLLTASDDNWLRLFDLPQDVRTAERLDHGDLLLPCEAGADSPSTAAIYDNDGRASRSDAAGPDNLSPALRMHAGETVYDYCWYSRMSATDPVSCCFASSCRGQPIHLWDACSGTIRCSYRGYNDVDEPTAAYSLAFSPDGGRLLGGYNKSIYVFDVARPGRDYKRIITHKRKQPESIAGIVSCLAFSAAGDVFAAGTYTGALGLFDARTYELLLILTGNRGGLTQVMFSSDGNYLYTGARQDDQMFCWDVRNTYEAVYTLQRDTAKTNQRVQFDIEPCGKHLITGGCDGALTAFDLQKGIEIDRQRIAADTVNGVAFHPCLDLLATASGAQHS
ncbi:hypothetical protein VOLCADRAFT_106969 [Volvox carteri f. nagariensis]|uniref:Uncharacterized protein n=1 Tax=Volvox carteri f. nagariensis TaxID=3068 RepID=D8UB09_VOLCA|nr:uncharacterized protein VOLCADRAFT_106969 [Volvox carteri f. nagariensis]EFJ43030.1 hypothetical protein VOLCADRAFT_106969 [Volvox carteri f. nagariensis]|eukprot:XP_002955829.1 hypothetical protein VOLCADRAFT_106969 [Volvox carteri f. nagariensis]